MKPHNDEYVNMLENQLDYLILDGRTFAAMIVGAVELLQEDLRGKIALSQDDKLGIFETLMSSANKYKERLEWSFTERNKMSEDE